jgi:hypothetical protein
MVVGAFVAPYLLDATARSGAAWRGTGGSTMRSTPGRLAAPFRQSAST